MFKNAEFLFLLDDRSGRILCCFPEANIALLPRFVRYSVNDDGGFDFRFNKSHLRILERDGTFEIRTKYR
jgi:hypothetical protein